MKDGFIFYKSFADAVKRLNDADRLKAYDALIDYGIYGKEPDCEGMAAVVLDLAKPQIDANIRRYENGCKGASFGKLGGRPKKDKNPDGVIDENPKEKPKKSKGEVKEKPKKDTYGLAGNVTLTQDEYNKLVAEFGMTETQKAIQYLDDYIADKGYKSKSNYSAMRRWVFNAVRERDQKAAKNAGLRPVDRFFADVEGAFYDNGGNQENIFCG